MNRVVMVLEMKSIDYELVEMNPYEKSELLIKINPILGQRNLTLFFVVY